MKKPKRQFTDEQKRTAVDEYVSGRKRAAEVAAELNISQGLLYKWRVQLAEEAKGERIEELEAQGSSPEQARRILELEEQLAEYQKKLGELTLINDLLKKLHHSKTSQPASELTGLIGTTKNWAQKKWRAK